MSVDMAGMALNVQNCDMFSKKSVLIARGHANNLRVYRAMEMYKNTLEFSSSPAPNCKEILSIQGSLENIDAFIRLLEEYKVRMYK